MQSKVYCSIDFGNSTTLAACTDPTGRPIGIRSDRGAKSWPTVVFKAQDGTIYFGEDAKEQALVFPLQSTSDFKMHLADKSKRYFGGTASASDVVALAARTVVDAVVKQLGYSIDGVVITCPANFNDASKQGLLDGFAKAGIRVVGSTSEPSAAAYAYSSEIKPAPGTRSLVMVWDLGGGTFDVAILKIEDGVAIPISTEGIPQLGGKDFSKVLKDYVLNKLSQLCGKVITADKLSPEQNAELDEKIEKLKEALSNKPAAKIALNFAGKPQLLDIAASDVEPLYAGFYKQMKECSDKALKDAKLDYKDIDRLVLAGGPFNSIRLQDIAATHTAQVPLARIDPSLAVSYGAAQFAQQKAREDGGLGALPGAAQLAHASSHDIGICVLDSASGKPVPVCSVIVKKNTPLTEKFEDCFRLERDNQTDALIDILQGPNEAPESQCLKIGTIQFSGLPPQPNRNPRIKVEFSFDSNGLCVVKATDLVGGKTQTVSVALNKKAA